MIKNHKRLIPGARWKYTQIWYSSSNCGFFFFYHFHFGKVWISTVAGSNYRYDHFLKRSNLKYIKKANTEGKDFKLINKYRIVETTWVINYIVLRYSSVTILAREGACVRFYFNSLERVRQPTKVVYQRKKYLSYKNTTVFITI